MRRSSERSVSATLSPGRLKRVATLDGKRDLDSLYKFSDQHRGPLRTLKRGDEVQWGKNLCAPCNKARSQPFDLAYDKFVQFMLDHGGELHRCHVLDWADVFGAAWEDGARNLSRYFVKQFACMMATERLDVPRDAIDFSERSTTLLLNHP